MFLVGRRCLVLLKSGPLNSDQVSQDFVHLVCENLEGWSCVSTSLLTLFHSAMPCCGVWLYLPTTFTVGLVPSYIIVSPGYTAALVEEEKRKQQQQRPKITLVISITESPKRRKQLLKPLPVRQMVEEVQLKNLSG